MKMYEFFNIGEIADFFQIPKSKLRYWDKEGLINLARNANNDYREYSIKAISEVANIMFYRSLDVPIKELKRLPEMSMHDFSVMLNKTELKIMAQLEELAQTRKRIQGRQKAIEKIKAYEKEPYVLGGNPLSKVVEFGPGNRKYLKHIIENPENFIIVSKLEPANEFLVGVALQSEPELDDVLIWQKKCENYLKCLLKLSHDPFENQNIGIEDLLEYLYKNNYKHGVITAPFLFAEFGDNIVNYHEAYVELL